MARNLREKPVVLSRIYTRTGDDGSTALADGSRTSKTDSRLAAYADVEEANSAIGAAVTFGGLSDAINAVLARVQNELFDVGADLANPISDAPPPYPPLRIDQAYIDRLESECDSFNEGLPVLRSFLLPGGTPGATLLHVARTVTRRAERCAWAAISEHGDTVSVLPAKYLNRINPTRPKCDPGGAASSQASMPVSAESARASSTVWPSAPLSRHSTMTRPGPRDAASPGSGVLLDTTTRSRRPSVSSGRGEMPNALNQRSSSSW